jgi:hypothetical protein
MTIADAMHECRFSGSRSAPGIADISSMAFNPFGKTFIFFFFSPLRCYGEARKCRLERRPNHIVKYLPNNKIKIKRTHRERCIYFKYFRFAFFLFSKTYYFLNASCERVEGFLEIPTGTRDGILVLECPQVKFDFIPLRLSRTHIFSRPQLSSIIHDFLSFSTSQFSIIVVAGL